MSENLELIIKKHVLKNAFDYGRANPGSVVGKVIGEAPDCKADMKNTMQLIGQEVVRVSKLTKDQIEKEMSAFEYIQKEEKKKQIELPNAIEGKVITRFPPEPSGYPHIGHAKAAWLDYESAQNYGGSMILRFDDTNPEKESYQYVEAIKEGLKWLGISWSNETYTSDNMSKIYDTAAKLIEMKKAYICTCEQEEISKNRSEATACRCRSNSVSENQNKWRGMLEGEIEAGKAILRYMGDLESQNTVMRDPTLARIMESKHYRQLAKYRVWPGYDLAVCVMDYVEGITHSMRSKEYELRDELYKSIFDSLGWKMPELIGFSRLNIKNAPISKRLLLPLVKEGKVMGWDDPRLPTLKGLERRGVLPAAIKQFVLAFGLSKVESEPEWEGLLAINRKMLDPQSKHFFFVANPIELQIEGLGKREIKLKLHPKQDIGERTINIDNKVWISQMDFEKLTEGEIFRLKDLCNVKLVKKEHNRIVGKIEPEGTVEKKLQWVGNGHLECEILVPKDLLDQNGEFNPDSLESIKGFCEEDCGKLKHGEIIQFERFGFCRFDNMPQKRLTFVYSC
ncbi:MAG: glutamate--tRNA ligase [Candidatus Bilamarchaeum sp.]|jgi:glutamyl-tRNA synthetase